MSDVGRKTVPDKGRLNRERPVTKALEFPFCTGKSFFIGNGAESTRWSVHRETVVIVVVVVVKVVVVVVVVVAVVVWRL